LSLSQMSRRDLSLVDLLDRILEKGVVINGDITVSVGSVELLSVKVNLVIASLETAKRYGLKLPWEEQHKARRPIRRVTDAKNYKVIR
jgi:gas vesicle protein GvpA/GvpJ/GvpM family